MRLPSQNEELFSLLRVVVFTLGMFNQLMTIRKITSQRKEVVLAKGHYFNEEQTYYEVREPIEM